jgi:hypothetical protein
VVGRRYQSERGNKAARIWPIASEAIERIDALFAAANRTTDRD